MAGPKPSSEHFMVRLPEGMRAQISTMAKSNLRSMNSEIVFHLQRAVRERDQAYENKSALESAATLARA